MIDAIIQAISEFFANTFSIGWLAVLIISMIPIIELKGAIPFGILYYGLPMWLSALVSLFGGAVVTLTLAFLLKPVFALLKKTRVFKGIVNWFEKKLKGKAEKIEKQANERTESEAGESKAAQTSVSESEAAVKTSSFNVDAFAVSERKRRRNDLIKLISVFLFVAIPLPGTGVWTGTAIAVFLELDLGKTIAAVTVGNAVASVIMCLISAVTGFFI